MKKTRKHFKVVVGEIFANLMSWVAGLLTAQLLSEFFAVRSWKNAWGLFSHKTTVDAQTFDILNWVVSAIIGFVVMMLFNKLIGNWISKKIDNQPEEESQK